MTLGVALFVATGLLVLTGADKPKEKAPPAAPALPAMSDAATAPARALSDAFAAVAEHIRPSVVSVNSAKVMKFRTPDFSNPFGDDSPFRFFFDNGRGRQQQPRQQPAPREHEYRQNGMGSGIIIDKEGHVLTNFHVVKDVDEISITLADKRNFKAKVVGTDPKTDLAIVQISENVPADLPAAELGDSDALRVGDWVLAVGAPFGLPQTVTAGIISAKGRANVGAADYEDFIQTDAAINPGNSGGPLVNLRGQVVGLNTAIASRMGQNAGVGFAIPINMIRHVMPTLIKGGKISRGMLGVVIQELNEDLAEKFGLAEPQGVLVTQVTKDSAADKAGIKVGDVITKFNGKDVDSVRQLSTAVAGNTPGTQAEITFLRDGKPRTVKAQLGELSSDTASVEGDESAPETANDLGLTIQPLTSSLAKQYGYEDEEGVVITGIEDGSLAASAGLQEGDLITEVNRQKVASVAEFRDATGKSKDKGSVLLLVKNPKGGSRFVIIKTK